MKKVAINDLSKEIANILEDYKIETDEKVVKLVNKVIKNAKIDLVKNSPKNTGDYAGGWSITIGQKGINFFSKVIYNKKHYRLTHLLEFGHATRDGDHTIPQPHVRPVENKYKEEFINELGDELKK